MKRLFGTTVACVLLACAVPAASAQRPLRTIIFGDSITWMSKGSLHRVLPGSLIESFPGTHIARWLPTISDYATRGVHRWAIELGTNDVLYGDPQWQSDLNDEISLVSSQDCVVLLTVNPRLPDYAKQAGPTSAQLNAGITAAVASHPNFHLLNWGAIEYRNPGWLGADHIHPTHAGSDALARRENLALQHCS